MSIPTSKVGHHQPEPWAVCEYDSGAYYIEDCEGNMSQDNDDFDYSNRCRIETCVNNCRDIANPHHLRLLIERASRLALDPFSPMKQGRLRAVLDVIGFAKYDKEKADGEASNAKIPETEPLYLTSKELDMLVHWGQFVEQQEDPFRPEEDTLLKRLEKMTVLRPSRSSEQKDSSTTF